MSKHILVFGAGKSATCLIEYLIKETAINGWQLTVADHDLALAESKTGHHAHVKAIAVDIQDEAARNQLVQNASLVISLLPPALHFLVTQTCIAFEKHLLTASYTDVTLRGWQETIANKNLFFLCEMGLDPGIDHMSAMQMIHRIKEKGGHITSFISHCGGLVAPESDDNPWHYKISWNPRNVVMAGKAGAVYRQNNAIEKKDYQHLFDAKRVTHFPGLGLLAWYPNRDSLDYIPTYGLANAATFIRTTLRHPDFCRGWQHIIDLQLTDETIEYDTDGLSLKRFFEQHFNQQPLSAIVGSITGTDIIFKKQLDWLGLTDSDTLINKGRCSAMDILQFALEKKLALLAADKDMIVMLHEIEYELQGKKYSTNSSLLVKGDDNLRTAMAKTVGLPLGIAAKLILNGIITEKGLHIPVIPAIYEPVLLELAQHGIVFEEETRVIA